MDKTLAMRSARFILRRQYQSKFSYDAISASIRYPITR